MKKHRAAKITLAVFMSLMLVLGLMPSASFANSGSPDSIPADQFGTMDIYSTASPGKVLHDDYRYSDKWFGLPESGEQAQPENENPALALLSMQMVAAACEDDKDGLGGEFLGKLGFEGIGFRGDKASDNYENIVDCNYTYGKKKVGDTTLVAVVLQSYAFDNITKKKGWEQNFTVNMVGDALAGLDPKYHFAFSKAADAVLSEIADLGVSGSEPSEKVKYWITGQSRGGALANLIAARLPGKLQENNLDNQGIYAYTFEAPAVVEPDNEDQGNSAYNYIHNYYCTDDIVTRIPPWNMKLYGVMHQLNTEATDAAVKGELEKLGVGDAVPDGYSRESAEKMVGNIVGAICKRVENRADYSKNTTEEIILPEGGTRNVEYNYQNICRKLMGKLFGGTLDGDILGKLSGELEEALSALEDFVRGYLREEGIQKKGPEANTYYWKAAQQAHELLDAAEVDLEFTDDELFAVLKLAAPALIDKDAGKESGYDPDSEADLPVLVYVIQALKIPQVIFSHHFETVVARLKALSPAPVWDGMDIKVAEPEAENTVTKMPRVVNAAVSGSGSGSWVSAAAKWKTEDNILKNNKVYYLEVDFDVKGHSVTNDTNVTINGEAPISREVSYKDCVIKISAVWKYSIGTPGKCTVSFGMRGHGQAPAPIELDEGTILKYVEKPDAPTADGYRFAEWTNGGKKWDEIVLTEDVRMIARWIRVIDDIDIQFEIPRVGEACKDPVVSKDAPYKISGFGIEDEDYNPVDTISKKEPLILRITISPASDSEFKFRIGEYENDEFDGTAKVNGTEAEVELDESNLMIVYRFTPMDAENKDDPKGGDSGNGNSGKNDPGKGDSGKGNPQNGDPGKGNPKDGDSNGNGTDNNAPQKGDPGKGDQKGNGNKKGEPQKNESKGDSNKSKILARGMTAAAAHKIISGWNSDKDIRGAKYRPLMPKTKKITKKSISLKWKKVKGAKSYVVYAAKSGNGNKLARTANVKGTSYKVKKVGVNNKSGVKIKKLKKARYYKFMIVAIGKDEKIISASSIIHAATKGSRKASNPVKVVIKAKIDQKGKKIKKYRAIKKTVIRKGKSVKIRTAVKKAKKTKFRKFIGVRYESSNMAVAKVSSKGRIKALSKGKVVIYAIAQNGKSKKIVVRVK